MPYCICIHLSNPPFLFGHDTMDRKISNVEPFYWLLGSAALIVVIAGLRAAQSLVVPFLIAAFIAVVCAPALQWLQRKGVAEWLY